ncbi:hypothetical protein [Ectopseudomonas khazarica]|uniref:hypothetical protein n=1 Tax=Ectopseudomonas khazarica TaxID=2502979 RepID=UPI0037C59A0E
MREASAPIDPIHSAMMLGMTPEPCEPIIEITRKAVTKLLDVVEFGDQLERVEKDRLVAFVKEILAEDQPELWAMHSVGPNEVHPMISKEEADRQASELIALCKQQFPEVPIIVNVIPSPYSPAEHFKLLAEDLTEQVTDLRQAVATGSTPAPAVAMPPEIPRNLLGKIVDELFGGAIEDTSAIEDVYRVIARSGMTSYPEGKYSNVLRPFFAMMEAELHANTSKGDRPAWLAMSPEQCLLEIYYHTAKLQKAVKNNDMKGVREYTADVANMSMMLADTCGWLDVVSSELANAEPAPPCNHEWTDDGQHLLVCTACGAQEDHDPRWRDMATAPRDGTMVRLLVEFTEHATEDADQAPTIGANNFENDGEDRWLFAGWCWSHDHFTQGQGEPVGWLPMLDDPRRIAPAQQEQQ